MPVRSATDRLRRLVLTEIWGVITAAEALEVLRQIRADPAFNRSFDILCDFTKVTESMITADESLVLLANTPFGAGARRAMVLPVTPYKGESGALREVALPVGGQVRVFHTREEALVWLGSG